MIFDVVVALPGDEIDAFCGAFSAPDYYCSHDEAVQAVKQRFQFNVIHSQSGLKIDVIIPEDSDFNRSRVARRVRVMAADGKEVWFASPEDVIIKKMEYFKEGRSERHIRDIVGVLRVVAEKLDRAYIALWAERLQLADIWNAILERAAKS